MDHFCGQTKLWLIPIIAVGKSKTKCLKETNNMNHVANMHTNVSEIKLPNVYFSICEIGIKRAAIDNESEIGWISTKYK